MTLEYLRTQGNEKLLPQAVGGDTEAEDVLIERGNYLDLDKDQAPNGKLARDVKGSSLPGRPNIYPGDDVKIVNGRITEVNGKPVG